MKNTPRFLRTKRYLNKLVFMGLDFSVGPDRTCVVFRRGGHIYAFDGLCRRQLDMVLDPGRMMMFGGQAGGGKTARQFRELAAGLENGVIE